MFDVRAALVEISRFHLFIYFTFAPCVRQLIRERSYRRRDVVRQYVYTCR